MFPIRDHNPSGRVPFVTYALLAINIAVFLSYWFTLRSGYELGAFYYTWGLVPAQLMQGHGLGGLITHMFLHGGWLHLAGNMLFLWIFGDNLEDEMGHVGYLLFYLTCGLAAAGLQVIGNPWFDGPLVGASGAIAGVLGGYLMLFPRARVDVLLIFIIFFRVFSIPAWIVLSVWFVVQAFHGYAATEDGVAYLAHIGGFVAGAMMVLPILLRRGGRAFWARNEGMPPHPEAKYKLSPSRIPRVPKR
ncbi:MAG: rhomboid family intrarane serine protease [Cypionkella sp.]|uniref:rhomboid family intramembrane serine protease n=1 Tax=Cypionkella sp. TaxID=2811411 RepID=UPI00262D8DFA|nr:rhomboid family intramembrane serine protease [Cypionkella sp.]MDB5660642.1 rhomboid family intrarane serine protease [Cypionkella sp.]